MDLARSPFGAQLVHPLLADAQDRGNVLPGMPFVVHRCGDEVRELGIKSGDSF